MKIFKKLNFPLSLIVTINLGFITGNSQTEKVPANIPANYEWNGREFSLKYGGKTVISMKLRADQKAEDFSVLVNDENNRITQVFKWASRQEPLFFTGSVIGSGESFPCEAEKMEDAPVMVRHSTGLSRSLLNRAVYDRKSDWLISLDFPTAIAVIPGKSTENENNFSFELSGKDILLRFRPSFYKSHRGLKYFTPWRYRVWKESVAGWCSWFAYFDKVTEKDMRDAADVLSDVLVPFGLEYLQIDDGYQLKPVGVPETWLVSNTKFPSGLAGLSSYISSKGLKPGIWTNVSFQQREFAENHKAMFVRNEDGKLAYGNWIGYIMDGANPTTITELIIPVYNQLKKMGWKYYKVDALRHLRYEGYNTYADYYKKKNTDIEIAFRNVAQSIRSEIGEENFMLGCWGIRPELVGIIDACRIGDDGFGYGGLAEYNSFNNIVWRNDPDHIELTPRDAYKSCMTTSLTGSVFMLTDKPEIYRTEIVEPAKRSLPVLFTLPGQVYDVDPSKSALIGNVKTELSGSGPRTFDADQREYCHLYLTEIIKPFEQWVVLGRTGGSEERIGFRELGLDPESEYHVFEFWSKEYLGSFHAELPFGEINPVFGCQLYCIRYDYHCPQVLATNRHITCGGYDLENVEWKNGKLSGKSRVVKNDIYVLYILEPDEFTMEDISVTGGALIKSERTGRVRKMIIKPGDSEVISWYITY